MNLSGALWYMVLISCTFKCYIRKFTHRQAFISYVPNRILGANDTMINENDPACSGERLCPWSKEETSYVDLEQSWWRQESWTERCRTPWPTEQRRERSLGFWAQSPTKHLYYVQVWFSVPGMLCCSKWAVSSFPSSWYSRGQRRIICRNTFEKRDSVNYRECNEETKQRD